MQRKIIVAGAGMAGCFIALYFANRGYQVRILEKRDSMSKLLAKEGRSFNLTLYYRGILALKKLRLWEEVKKFAEVAEGNVAHLPQKSRFDRFDNSKAVLYTIHRTSLNKLLLQIAKSHKNITINFHSEIVSLDKLKKTLLIKDSLHKKNRVLSYSLLIGADGAYSIVRSLLQRGQQANHSLKHSDWGYKEVWISPKKAQKMNLREKATHTWPRDNSLLLAFPNPDKSLTLMFNLPISGPESFSSLTTKHAIHHYLTENFPDLTTLEPEITHAFLKKPLGQFTTVLTSPWYFQDSIVLVGDAAHAVLPFYGQGVCAAFEDCLSVGKWMLRYPNDTARAFAAYQAERKPNTDLLADLSLKNFIELRDKSRSERFVIKDRVYSYLHSLFPKLIQPPLYVLVAHQSISYIDAVKKYESQNVKATLLGIDVILFIVVLAIQLRKIVTSFLVWISSLIITNHGRKQPLVLSNR